MMSVASVLCVTAALSAHTPLRMSTRGRWIVDEYGRVRIFHGMNDIQHAKNIQSEGGEFLPGPTRIESNLDMLEKAGMNGFRMPMMWAGVNPSEGRYNSTYAAIMRDQVGAKMGPRGMYSFLDMHQDVLSSRYPPSYDGAPRWVVDKTNPVEQFPWPFEHNITHWADGYFTEAVGQSFEDIYRNNHGNGDAWRDAWVYIASQFKDVKSVLGYELMNEPWCGNIWADPTYLLPEEAGRRNLLPNYDRIVRGIRTVDNETITFFEPVTWGMVLPGDEVKMAGNGFDHIPGGPENADKSVFSWHYYCWVLTGSAAGKYNPFDKAACDRGLGPLVMDTVIDDILKLGSASFLTEFGAVAPDQEHPDSEGTEEIEFVLNEADRTLQSWTYWEISGCLKPGTLELDYERVAPFVRPFAQATSGIPSFMNWHNATSTFTFTYHADPTIPHPTVITVPEANYPAGFRVTAKQGVVAWDLCNEGLGQQICVSCNQSEIVTLTIKPLQ